MSRIETEKQTVAAMIRLYCRKKHGCLNLCEECFKLQQYAEQRLERCQFGEEKTICAKCPVHCYKPDMRQKVKERMRFSGPLMILYHPVMAVKHMVHKRSK